MKKKIILISLIVTIIMSISVFSMSALANTDPSATSIPPDKEWDNIFGGEKSDNFESVTKTRDGGYVAVGWSYSSASGEINDTSNSCYIDALIVKFDANGNKLWDNLFGGTYDDFFYSVIETSDGGFLASGWSNSSASGEISDTNNGYQDCLLVKFDANGKKVWDNLFGGGYIADEFNSIIQSSDGGYVAVGSSYSPHSGDISDYGNGGSDGLIVKFDATGNKVWDNLYGGGNGPDHLYSVVETSDGGFVAVGSIANPMSNDYGEINDANFNGYAYDSIIVKFDADGKRIWDNLFGGAMDEQFKSVTTTSDEGFIAVGWSSSSASGEISDTNNGAGDCLIVKFDANGKKIWDNLIGSNSNDFLESVIKTSDGCFIAVGFSCSSTISGEISDIQNGSIDGLIVKFDANGNKLWDNLFGGTGIDKFKSILETSDGSLIAVGYTTSSATGEISDTNNGNEDGLIVKFNPLLPGPTTVTVNSPYTNLIDVVINWTEATNATKYNVSVWDLTNLELIRSNLFVTETSVNLGRLPSDNYCIIVIPYNNELAGKNYGSAYFEVTAPKPGSMTLSLRKTPNYSPIENIEIKWDNPKPEYAENYSVFVDSIITKGKTITYKQINKFENITELSTKIGKYAVGAYRVRTIPHNINGDGQTSTVNINVVNNQVALFPMNCLQISQTINGTGTDDPTHMGSNAIDICGKDTNCDDLYAPFDCYVMRIKSSVVAIQSVNKVLYADGTLDYMTIMLEHDNDVTNLYAYVKYDKKTGTYKTNKKIIQQGDVFYQEGNADGAFGNHVHMETGKGKYVIKDGWNDGWYTNIYGYYQIYNDIRPDDALFLKTTTVDVNSNYHLNHEGLYWQYLELPLFS